jgi:phosphotransferase system HPr (HPr) family protein
MNGEPLRRKVVITDPQGLHLRPMSVFVQQALRYQSTVTICKDDLRVNGKSALELMLLAAVQGTELTLEVAGPDAAEAAEVLANLLATPTPEEACEPPSKG